MRRILIVALLVAGGPAVAAGLSSLTRDLARSIQNAEHEVKRSGINSSQAKEAIEKAQSICQEICKVCFDGVECNLECAKKACTKPADQSDGE